MGVAIAGRKLHQAELVAARQQPESFRIKGDGSAQSNPAAKSPL